MAGAVRDQHGFTMLEVLVTAALLVGGVLGSVALIQHASGTTSTNKAREGATSLHREIVDVVRAISYGSLTGTDVETALRARPDLVDSSPAAGYTIARRGYVYTVETAACAIDDAKDGRGTHDVAVSFCSDSPGPGSTDRNADDYRRVTVTLSWDRRGRTELSRQITVVNNPAGGLGPSVTDLRLSTLSSPITDPAVTSADFDVTLSTSAETVRWAIDGDVQGDASGSGTSWSFSWDLDGWSDGTYVVQAQGFDADGRSGVTRKLTVVLNRNAPAAPSGFDGGRNGLGGHVDLEWLASSEGDVVGYRVYRTDSAGTVIERACPAPGQGASAYVEATSCIDENAPASGTLYYEAVALDVPPAGGLREGTATAVVETDESNAVPGLPGDVTLCTGGSEGCTLPDGSAAPSGTTVVGWSAASDGDGSVSFYRIYRDGSDYASRYGRVYPGGTLKFVDTAPGETTHSYRLTAIDDDYGESAKTAEVTG